MSWIMVDIESDGPIPGDYSMIEIGAVIVDDRLDTTFYSQIKPISDNYKMESLAVSGYSREDTLSFRNPEEVMLDFKTWILQNSVGKPLFISDNNGFDWMFVCWYFHHFLSDNPFGHSSANLGSLYKGIVRNTFENFKHLRKTKHSHNPLNDAMGNAEAFLQIITHYDLKL